MKKRLRIILCMMACILGAAYYSGAALAGAEENAARDGEQRFEDVTEGELTFLDENLQQFITGWSSLDFNNEMRAVEAEQNMKLMMERYPEWKELQESMGTFISAGETLFEEQEGLLHVKSVAEYAKGSLTFSLTYDPIKKAVVGIPTVSTMKDNIGESMGEKLSEAGLNTIMGISVVFIVLIFMSFVIWLFNFIPVLQKKFRKKEDREEEITGSMNNTINSIAQQEEELADDLELVAVITAAVAASMGKEAAADGLVVRSIRRRNTGRPTL